MQSAIEINNLSVAFGSKTILSDITMQVPAGKLVGLLGPSGAGKTTLIKSILGLQPASAGEVTVLGAPAGDRAKRSQIGYMSQKASVYTDLTVDENIRYFSALTGANKSEADATLRSVELESRRQQIVSSLSGGQLARVSLAIALLGKPKLLLLDEPTVGLDPVLRLKLWQHFTDLAAQGMTILISSHTMDEADRCDEILFLRDGHLLAAGSRQDILAKTKANTMETAFLNLAGQES